MKSIGILFTSVGITNFAFGVLAGYTLGPLESWLGWCGVLGVITALSSVLGTFFITQSSAAMDTPIKFKMPALLSDLPVAQFLETAATAQSIESVNVSSRLPKFSVAPDVYFLPLVSATDYVLDDIQGLYDSLNQFRLPQGRRLIISQLRVQTRLAEAVEVVIRERRSLNDAILRGFSIKTDLMPAARISSTLDTDQFWKFVYFHYKEVVIIAPESERELWLELYSLPTPILSSERKQTPSVHPAPRALF
jgi:hypothetical protein